MGMIKMVAVTEMSFEISYHLQGWEKATRLHVAGYYTLRSQGDVCTEVLEFCVMTLKKQPQRGFSFGW